MLPAVVLYSVNYRSSVAISPVVDTAVVGVGTVATLVGTVELVAGMDNTAVVVVGIVVRFE